MKSVVIQQPEQLAIEERPIPQPQAGKYVSAFVARGSAAQTYIFFVGIIRSPNILALSVMNFLASLMPLATV